MNIILNEVFQEWGGVMAGEYGAVFKSEQSEKTVLEACDAALASWPVPYRLESVPTRLDDTRAIVCGTPGAPPLVLLHGSGTNSLFWKGDIARYAAGYRVYAVDIPGEPGFSSRTRGDWNGSEYPGWIGDVMEGFGLGQAGFVGCSIGGFFSLRFATLQPEKVTKLVLLGSSGLARQRLSFIPKALFFMAFGRSGIDRILKTVNGGVALPAEALDFARLLAIHSSPRMGQVPLIPDQDLKRLSMPVLAIGGEKDALLDTRASLARLASLVPSSKILEIAGTGHVVTGMIDTIMDFLEEA